MNTIPALSVNQQALVPVSFHGNMLYVVNQENQPYTPMRPIVEGMGLDWKSQHTKLQSARFKSTMAEITTVAEDGKKRQMICLPLRKLPGWLMSIHPNKVKAEIRERVIAYQNECDDILWKHWEEKYGNLYRIAEETITSAQQRRLQEAVAHRAFTLPEGQRAGAYPKLWGGLKSHFKVGTYKDLNPAQFEAALSYIDSYQWEIVEEKKSGEEKVGAYINLNALCCLMMMGAEHWRDLYKALSAMKSPFASQFYDIFNDGNLMAKFTLKAFKDEILEAQKTIPEEYRRPNTLSAKYLATLQ